MLFTDIKELLKRMVSAKRLKKKQKKMILEAMRRVSARNT
jgi:hypothetical protein